MSARVTVVHVECSGKNQDFLGGDDRRVAHPVLFRFLHPSGEVSRAAGLTSNSHTFRSLIGKYQRHL
jgi:hypothetical protein